MVQLVLLLACRPPDGDPPTDALDAGALPDATFALPSIGPRGVATPEEEAARASVAGSFVYDAWRPGTVADTLDAPDLEESAAALRTIWRLLVSYAGIPE